mgnify:CR=1 FL=1
MGMQDQMSPSPRRASGRASQARFDPNEARGPVIDQDGREIPQGPFQGSFQGAFNGAFEGPGGIRFDFQTANPFGNLTREQRITRLEAVAKLLDVAFVLPGTNIRYGIDGIIGLIPVIGDLIATALSLWLVREARALGAPWHVITRMLGNVAVEGVIGMVPVAGDAFDVLFRANMRNARILRRWLDTQPR